MLADCSTIKLCQKDVIGHSNATVIGCQAREREGAQRHSSFPLLLMTHICARAASGKNLHGGRALAYVQ